MTTDMTPDPKDRHLTFGRRPPQHRLAPDPFDSSDTRAVLKFGEIRSFTSLLPNPQNRPFSKSEAPLFEREDWTLFRSLNTLGQKAGVGINLIPKLVAKELADNALDASGDCRVGSLSDGNGFWIEDDGDGIPGSDEEIASLFSINRPLTSSKILRKPTRGALGNGLRVVAGAVLASDGGMRVSTRGRTLELSPQRETGLSTASRIGDWDKQGCRVELLFGPSLAIDQHVLEWANQAIRLAAGKSSYKGKSSPYWYDSETFHELLQACKNRTVRELVAELDGCAEPKAGKICEGFRGRLAKDISATESDQILESAKQEAKPVRAERLGCVGPIPSLPPGYAKAVGRLRIGSARSKIEAEVPVVVEAWAQVAKDTSARLSVNRTPITGKLIAWTNKTELCLEGCSSQEGHWEIKSGKKPIKLWINIDTPYMPITTDGKEPDIDAFIGLIREVVGKAIVRAKREMPTQKVQTPKKDILINAIPEGVAMASGDGTYRFSQRQLFYAIRPLFIEAAKEAPDWGYFCSVITDFEESQGEITGMYRDPRGVVYHPHVGEDIPLGTLQVEKYQRPEWLFNKVLYCEKEGFFEIFKSAKWAERNDCALMTSKGFSSRAARDLIDFLASTDEECKFFCIHDADAQGTMIYQTLQSATKARGARKVEIINLGLDPAEARDMELQVEPVERGHTKAVAEYISDNDRLWLQTNRVELNAMTTPQFLDWLDRKFAPYAGKVIPPSQVLGHQLNQGVRIKAARNVQNVILEENHYDDRVKEEMARLKPYIDAAMPTLTNDVREALTTHDAALWTAPVDDIAREIARRTAG
jgi:hypothetical protein